MRSTTPRRGQELRRSAVRNSQPARHLDKDLGQVARNLSLPLSLAMFAILRRGSLLSASTVALMGSLAVAAKSATAMSIFHSLDATVMISIWNPGAAALIVAVGSFLAHR